MPFKNIFVQLDTKKSNDTLFECIDICIYIYNFELNIERGSDSFYIHLYIKHLKNC